MLNKSTGWYNSKSLYLPILSGTDRCGDERCHELSTTNVSSTPIPKSRKGAARFKLMNSTPM